MVEETLRQTIERIYDKLTRNDGDLHGGSDKAPRLHNIHRDLHRSR